MYEIDIKLKCANELQFIQALQSIIADAFLFKGQISGNDAGGIDLRKEESKQGNNLYAYKLNIPDMTESKYEN